MTNHKIVLLTLCFGSVIGFSAAGHAGIEPGDPVAGSWSDKETTMHIIRSQGEMLALSGTDRRSVFLLECRQPKGSESPNVFTCTGKGFNEKGEFKITSLLTLQGTELIDRWTAEQGSETFSGESRMRQASTVGSAR